MNSVSCSALKILAATLGVLAGLYGGDSSAAKKPKAPVLEAYPAIVDETLPPISSTGCGGSSIRTISSGCRGGGGSAGREGSPLETRRLSKESEKQHETIISPNTPTDAPLPVAANTHPKRTDRPENSGKGPGFDQVPAEHLQSIAGRLKIIEQLIVQHGRAYDYRAISTQQLQGILEKLSKEKK